MSGGSIESIGGINGSTSGGIFSIMGTPNQGKRVRGFCGEGWNPLRFSKEYFEKKFDLRKVPGSGNTAQRGQVPSFYEGEKKSREKSPLSNETSKTEAEETPEKTPNFTQKKIQKGGILKRGGEKIRNESLSNNTKGNKSWAGLPGEKKVRGKRRD